MDRRENAHFKGKDVLQHMLETKVKATVEPHGFELPPHLFAALDTARHLALLILILFIILQERSTLILGLFSLGALIGFSGRSAWLGWSQLERLHRNLKQEHYEIEHHRSQEREELKALYTSKGFQEPLLGQVVDVLMADENRLLRVMLEEEMGLSLESTEHPLKYCLGSFVGGLATILLCSLSLLFSSGWILIILCFLIMGVTAAIAAHLEKNKLIPSTIWSLGIGALAFFVVFFTRQIFT